MKHILLIDDIAAPTHFLVWQIGDPGGCLNPLPTLPCLPSTRRFYTCAYKTPFKKLSHIYKNNYGCGLTVCINLR